MPICYEDHDSGVRLIRISGRMDIPGTTEIDAKFAILASSGQHWVVVDLTEVSFLASIGIRSLISNAKAQQHRGGKFVLVVGTNEGVRKTLETTGIDSLIPMFADLAAAESAVRA